MREEHFYIQSNDNHTKIHVMKWIPDGEIRAVVQLVHGMAEYIERYREFAQYLNEHGIFAVGHDHLGHGDSAVSEADYGYFAKENGNQILVRDIHRVFLQTKKEYGQVPYVILGHSMGSFLVRQYVCCYGTELDGAIISGTASQPEWMLKAALGLCRLEAQILGWRYQSRLFQFVVAGSSNTAFKPNRTSCDWLSRDESVVDAYVEDPRCGFTFTLNGFYNLFLTLYKIGRKEYLERMPRRLPVLFLAGEKDPVGNFGKGVQEAVDLFQKTGMKDVECKLYPDARHEVLNELNKEEVYGDVLLWMEQHHLL